jgi:cell wall-associated NlpC family hydrolase
VQLDPKAQARSGRGRHRAAPVPTSPGRSRARFTIAAVTTGTVAVSGVALAGCAQVTPTDTEDASVSSPVTLGSQFGSQATLAGSRTSVNPAVDVSGSGSITNNLIQQTQLHAKTDVDLKVTNPNISVKANDPVEVGFSLYNQDANVPLAGQRIKIQVKLPAGWATFKYLYTNERGFASYTAKVLTTTQVTAVFDGTNALQSAFSDNVGTLNVIPDQPALPAQASRTTDRTVIAVADTQVAAPVASSSLGARAVYLTSQQAGKPYVYGAEGPYAFDCSGLIQYVFKQLGRSLPRTAEGQYEASTKVSQYNKQIGDLIFFGTPGNIYHVGIYAGNGKMWAAPKSGDVVRLESIWSTTYLVGRIL